MFLVTWLVNRKEAEANPHTTWLTFMRYLSTIIDRILNLQDILGPRIWIRISICRDLLIFKACRDLGQLSDQGLSPVTVGLGF